MTNLPVAFEDVAFEDIGGAVSSNVGEYLQVWTVVGDVEDAIYRMVHNLNALAAGAVPAAATE